MSSTIDKNNTRIARNTVFLYLRLAIVMIVNLYTTRIVLEVLGVSDYGIYNVVCGFVSMFGVLNTSMSNGVQRFYNYELGRNGEGALINVFNTSVLIQMTLTILLVVLLESFGLWYLNSQMEIPSDRIIAANYIFQFSIISLIFIVLQVPYSAAIIAYEKMDFYAIVSVLDVIIKLLAAFIIPHLHGDRLITYGLLLSSVGFLNFILYYWYCKRKFSHLKFKWKFDRQLFKTMFSFSGWNLFGTFAYMTKGQGVNVLLNSFFGTVVNAANGIATQVSSAIQTFASNLVLAFKPQLTQSYATGEYKRVASLMFSMSKISFMLVCILAIPIMVDLDYVLKLWLGDNVPTHTISFTRLVIITMMISVLNTPLTQVVHATGKMRKYQLTTSFIICSILPISWLFLKMGFGAQSVFYIGIIVTIINQIACLLVVKRVFDFSLAGYIREVVLFCCSICILPLVVSLFISDHISDSLSSFIILFIVCLVLICISALLLLNKKEKEMILSIFKKIINKRKNAN